MHHTKNKEMKLFLMLIIGMCYSSQSNGQSNEIQELAQNKVNIFSSKGLTKSRGLIFSLKYPASYSQEEHSNQNVVMQFVDNMRYNMIMNVGVVQVPNIISKEREITILSKVNLQTSVQTVSNDAIFIGYKTNFTVNRKNASYLEYISLVSAAYKTIIRQYFIVYKNYFITMSFSIPVFPNSTLEKTKIKFQNFKPVFEKIVNTFSTSN